jgi:hypothetical protein
MFFSWKEKLQWRGRKRHMQRPDIGCRSEVSWPTIFFMTGIAAGIMRGPGGTGDRALVTPVIRSGFDFGPAFQEKDGDGNSSRGGPVKSLSRA